MKNSIFILIVGSLFIGCSVERLKKLSEKVDDGSQVHPEIDMFGDTFTKRNRNIAIMEFERDVINNDVIYLTIYVNPKIGNPFDTRKTVELKREQNKQFMKFMNKYNYKYFNIIDKSDAGGAENMLLGTRYYLYSVHFHKTEEDFDKWDVRYKN